MTQGDIVTTGSVLLGIGPVVAAIAWFIWTSRNGRH